jgi:hypothetical protein
MKRKDWRSAFMSNQAMKTATTDKRLLDALTAAVKKKRSTKEVTEQKISFIYSAMDKDSGVTKERIREALAE